MTQYIVGVREVHVQYIKVEASSVREALEIVSDGCEGDEALHLEYSHTMGVDSWSVEEVIDNGLVVVHKNPYQD